MAKPKLAVVESEPKIEKGVPVPRARETNISQIFRSMEPGDSVFLAGRNHNGLGTRFALLRPAKFTVRSVDGGVRVWRIS